jgi:hypothetical protein
VPPFLSRAQIKSFFKKQSGVTAYKSAMEKYRADPYAAAKPAAAAVSESESSDEESSDGGAAASKADSDDESEDFDDGDDFAFDDSDDDSDSDDEDDDEYGKLTGRDLWVKRSVLIKRGLISADNVGKDEQEIRDYFVAFGGEIKKVVRARGAGEDEDGSDSEESEPEEVSDSIHPTHAEFVAVARERCAGSGWMQDVLDFVVAPKYGSEGERTAEQALAAGHEEFEARLKGKLKTGGVDLRAFRELLEFFKREAHGRKRKHARAPAGGAAGGVAAGAAGAKKKKVTALSTKSELFEALKEIVAERGKKGTNAAEQVAAIRDLVTKSARFGPAPHIKLLVELIVALLDVTRNKKVSTAMPQDMWTECVLLSFVRRRPPASAPPASAPPARAPSSAACRKAGVLSRRRTVCLYLTISTPLSTPLALSIHAARHALFRRCVESLNLIARLLSPSDDKRLPIYLRYVTATGDLVDEDSASVPREGVAEGSEWNGFQVVDVCGPKLELVIKRLDSEYTKSLQQCDHRTVDYKYKVMQDEEKIVELAKLMATFFGATGATGAEVDMALIQIQHRYYMHDAVATLKVQRQRQVSFFYLPLHFTRILLTV